jgi:diacylglycerol kinase family enzyme
MTLRRGLALVYARLIVNPAAGAGRTARKWPQLRKLLQSIGLHFDYDLTEGPRHAVELARSAVGKGYALVVSVGGDGTVNEVVNGLYETGSIRDVTLGIISTGTGSDFIRTIGLPRSYEEAGRRLTHATGITVDLGLVDYRNGDSLAQRLFVNFAGVGFAAKRPPGGSKPWVVFPLTLWGS